MRWISRAVILLLLTAAIPYLALAQSQQNALQAGIKAYEARDFAAAERAFSALVRAEPSAQNYGYLATAEAANGDLPKAIADFQRSIQLGDHSPRAFYNLGLAYVQIRQPARAIHAFRNALQAAPDDPRTLYALGVTLLRSGHAAQASQIFQDACRKRPSDARLWARLAEAQFESGNSTEAIKTAQNAMQAIPNNPRLAVTLAKLCLDHRQIQTARALLEDANEMMPEDAEVRLLLARTSVAAGEPVEALAVLRGLSVSEKQAEEKLELKGEAEALAGNLAAAQADLASVATRSPKNARYLVGEAWILQLRGKHDEAIKVLRKAGSLDPQAPAIPYRMAVSYYFLHQYSRAEESCRAAVRLNPRYQPAYLLRGITEMKEKASARAVFDLKKAESLSPQQALARRELGEAMFQAGNLRGAHQQLDEALKLDPKDAEGYYWRAKVLAAEGAKQQAIGDLNTSVEISPNFSEAYQELAKLYSETGQRDRAAKILIAKKKESTAPRGSGESLLRSPPEDSR